MSVSPCFMAGNKGCGVRCLSSRATATASVNVQLMPGRFGSALISKRENSDFHRYGTSITRMSRTVGLPRAVPETRGNEETQTASGLSLSTTMFLLFLSSIIDSSPLASANAEGMSSSPPASSYYVSLGLFLFTLPGLWSLIKRSPKAKIKRKTFEVAGPAVAGHMPLDTRARQIFNYFKNYNYTVKETGEVIIFEGNYRASVGQAAALVLYTAISLASTALVLSIAAPFGGNWWYLMTLISPAAGTYYFKNADRTEEFQVKMTTSDDDKTTDIIVQGDEEEIDRFRKELDLYEKGMEYVKGILE